MDSHSKPREERSFTDYFPHLDPHQPLHVVSPHPSVPSPSSSSTPEAEDVRSAASANNDGVVPDAGTLYHTPKQDHSHEEPLPPVTLPKRPTLPVAHFRRLPADTGYESASDTVDRSVYTEAQRHFKRPEGHYIRNSELSETELAERTEYDMDEEDQCWLDLINQTRREQGLNPVPNCLFELLIDRLEKAWFDLTKQIQRALAVEKHTQLPPEESACSICGEEECENSNAIVFCDGCNLAVHQDCYGVPYIPEGQWLCRRCMIAPETRFACLFCPFTDGAFKKTTSNQWAHLLCTFWIPEVTVANTVYMEPIDNVDKIPKSRWRLHCYICKRRRGACIQCSNKTCYTAFHVTCARKARLYLKMKTHRFTGEPMFRSYCDRHAPPDYREPPDFNAVADALTRSDAEIDQQHARLQGLDALLAPPSPAPGALQGKGTLIVSSKKPTKRKPVNLQHPPEREALASSPAFVNYNALCPTIPEYLFQRLLRLVPRPPVRQRVQFFRKAARYWTLKRQSRRGAPLIKRLHLEPWTASASQQRAAELESERQYTMLQHVRKDLERIRMLVELVRKREREKLKRFRLQREYLETFIYPMARVLWPVLQGLQAGDPHGFFSEPVSTALVPDYLDVISHPMDFGTIATRLQNYGYHSLPQFAKDVELVFSNAVQYNRPDTPYHKAALRLRKKFAILWAEAQQQYHQLPFDSHGVPLVPPSPLIFDFGESSLPFSHSPTLSPHPPPPASSSTPPSASTPTKRKRRFSQIDQDKSESTVKTTTIPTPSPLRLATRSMTRQHPPAALDLTPTAQRVRATVAKNQTNGRSAHSPTVTPQTPRTPQTPAPFRRKIRGKIELKVGEMVWAKAEGYPWFPAEICNPKNTHVVPDNIRTQPHQTTDWLVKFYDRDLVRRTFAWLPKSKLELLGIDETRDDHFLHLAVKCRSAAMKKQVFVAYEAIRQILDKRRQLRVGTA
ncbi:hypothetical protein IWQ61_003297 [Dispira simplex]|nr:hypothetical protein IWQ61_003297 [Dispira simplex]